MHQDNPTILRCITATIQFGGDKIDAYCEANSSFDDAFRSVTSHPLFPTDAFAAGIIPLVRFSNRLNGNLVLSGERGALFVDFETLTGKWFVLFCDPPRTAGSDSRFSQLPTTDESIIAGALDLCDNGCFGTSKFITPSRTS